VRQLYIYNKIKDAAATKSYRQSIEEKMRKQIAQYLESNG